MEGWIKLHRELINKPIWRKSTEGQRSVLIGLLMLVNHEPAEWEWQGQKFKCEPGQIVTSLQSLADKIGVSVKTVRSSLERFEKYGFLANQSASTGRLITLTNWESYQVKQDDPANDSAKQGQTEGKARATNKNDKNNNNISSPSEKAQSAPHPIWGDAVELLVSNGEKESSARAFLGRALNEYEEGALEEAISACIIQQPVNPKAFLMACLQNKRKKKSAKGVSGNRIVPASQREAGVMKF